MQDSKKLTVSFGTFACVLEGFDDPFNLMTSTVAYFKSIAENNPSFGRYDEFADFEELSHRIARETGEKEFELALIPGGVHIRSVGVAEPAVPAAGPDAEPAENDEISPQSEETAEQHDEYVDQSAEEDPTETADEPVQALNDETDETTEQLDNDQVDGEMDTIPVDPETADTADFPAEPEEVTTEVAEADEATEAEGAIEEIDAEGEPEKPAEMNDEQEAPVAEDTAPADLSGVEQVAETIAEDNQTDEPIGAEPAHDEKLVAEEQLAEDTDPSPPLAADETTERETAETGEEPTAAEEDTPRPDPVTEFLEEQDIMEWSEDEAHKAAEAEKKEGDGVAAKADYDELKAQLAAAMAELEPGKKAEQPAPAAASDGDSPANEGSNIVPLTSDADEPAAKDLDTESDPETKPAGAEPLVLKAPALRLGPQMTPAAEQTTGKIPPAGSDNFIDALSGDKDDEPAKKPLFLSEKSDDTSKLPASNPVKTEYTDSDDDAEKAGLSLGKLKVPGLSWRRKEEGEAAGAPSTDAAGAGETAATPTAEKAEGAAKNILRIISSDRDPETASQDAVKPQAAADPAKPAEPVARKPAAARDKSGQGKDMADRLHASFTEPAKKSTAFSLGEETDLDPLSAKGFVQKSGASSLGELMEACAAYTVLVDGETSFTRGEIMSMVQDIAGKDSFSAEARIKAFGKLVRGGQFLRFDGGTFTAAPDLIESHRERQDDIAV